jgi:hypothetical protein
MERFNLKKLNDIEGEEQYEVKISNRFRALENLDDDTDINRVLETITEHNKVAAKERLHYYKLKQHKPWFNQNI